MFEDLLTDDDFLIDPEIEEVSDENWDTGITPDIFTSGQEPDIFTTR